VGAVRSLRIAAAAALTAAVAVPVARAVGPTPSPYPGCGPVGVAGGEWRSYGHDAANTRFQDHEKQISPADVPTLAPAWTLSTSRAGAAGDITGTPIVADGCLYVGTNAGWVVAANADDGTPVWKTKMPRDGGISSSVTADGGTIYASVAPTGAPYVVALDQATGVVKWASEPIDTQPGADSFASPVVFDGLVVVGVSGGAAELGEEADRYGFQGSIVLLDAATGAVVKKTWTIHPPKQPDDDFAGATVWSTPAVDPATKYAYVGAGNPFKPQAEHAHANAVLKIDLDRAHPTFGEIVASYKGTVDEYVPGFSDLPCYDFDGNNPPYYPQGVGQCGDIDLDFGASPNLFTDPATGRTLVGAGQKSGVYHVFDADTMKPVWTAIVGPPTPFGGIVGSTAFDGASVYGPVTAPGHLWSLARADGSVRWLSPTLDGAHWGNPVAVANGVVYTADLKGFLDAYEARTGVPLAHRPLLLGADNGGNPMLSWGGVSIARNTVYAAVGIDGLPDGFVVALRPGGGGGGIQPPALPGIPQPSGAGATVVAGPGAVATTYATATVTVPRGSTVDFLNLDVPQHDVRSTTAGLFASELIGTGQTAPVTGVDRLGPGSYGFYCSLHPNMKGTLTVT
jgi:polyvinyl alcohol dehydrogenase (cytochrome)